MEKIQVKQFAGMKMYSELHLLGSNLCPITMTTMTLGKLLFCASDSSSTK